MGQEVSTSWNVDGSIPGSSSLCVEVFLGQDNEP